MKKLKPPKVGDKYATIGHSYTTGHAYVEGMYFVTSVRGGLVSLGKENKPDPKAHRSWRVWDSNGGLHTTTKWSHARAEPWEERHQVMLRRQQALYLVQRRFETHKSEGFEQLTDDDIQKLLDVLSKRKEQHEGDGEEARTDADEG